MKSKQNLIGYESLLGVNEDFSNFEDIIQLFNSDQPETLKIATNLNQIVSTAFSFGNKLILYQNSQREDVAVEFDKFIFVHHNICIFKNLFDHLTQSNRQTIFESSILYLMQIDTQKEKFRFERANKTLLSSDEIISSINASVLRILDRNNPNSLYQTLFELQEKWRLKTIQDPKESQCVKFKGILVKLILKLTRILKKILFKTEIKSLMSLLNFYFTKYKNFSESMYLKTIKTIMNELVILKGPELYQYYEHITEKKDPSFLLCINKYLDRFKEKED